MDPRVAELIEAAIRATRKNNCPCEDCAYNRILRLDRAIAAFAKPDGGRMTTQAIGEPE